MADGTFIECSHCRKCSNCCKSFDKINPPVLNLEEIKIIKDLVHENNFYNKIDKNLYSLKIIDNKCIFYENNQCTIYDKRPNDCKLYPFDIIKKDSKYYLILYKLDCLDYKEFVNNTNNIETIIGKISPWIKEFTDIRNYTKMLKKQYIIIRELK